MRSTENRPYSEVPLPKQTQNLVGKSVSIPHSGNTRAGFALLPQPNQAESTKIIEAGHEKERSRGQKARLYHPGETVKSSRTRDIYALMSSESD